jgi:hypothetical protein
VILSVRDCRGGKYFQSEVETIVEVESDVQKCWRLQLPVSSGEERWTRGWHSNPLFPVKPLWPRSEEISYCLQTSNRTHSQIQRKARFCAIVCTGCASERLENERSFFLPQKEGLATSRVSGWTIGSPTTVTLSFPKAYKISITDIRNIFWQSMGEPTQSETVLPKVTSCHSYPKSTRRYRSSSISANSASNSESVVLRGLNIVRLTSDTSNGNQDHKVPQCHGGAQAGWVTDLQSIQNSFYRIQI